MYHFKILSIEYTILLIGENALFKPFKALLCLLMLLFIAFTTHFIINTPADSVQVFNAEKAILTVVNKETNEALSGCKVTVTALDRAYYTDIGGCCSLPSVKSSLLITKEGYLPYFVPYKLISNNKISLIPL